MTDAESRPAPHDSQSYSLQHTDRYADDSVLGPLIELARRDTETLGILLHGSRGAGMEDERSDYDLLWILTDREYQRRVAAEQCAPQVTMIGERKHIELAYASPDHLLGAGMPEWFIRGLATARILVDRNGEVERLMNDLLAIPEERVRRDVPEMFDAYLNGFYRSMVSILILPEDRMRRDQTVPKEAGSAVSIPILPEDRMRLRVDECPAV